MKSNSSYATSIAQPAFKTQATIKIGENNSITPMIKTQGTIRLNSIKSSGRLANGLKSQQTVRLGLKPPEPKKTDKGEQLKKMATIILKPPTGGVPSGGNIPIAKELKTITTMVSG